MTKLLRLIFSLLVSIFSALKSEANSNYNAHDFSFNSVYELRKIDLSAYKGNLILVVNTASKCGFTKQYNDLERLWQTYRERGLIVIAVPSNDFMNQEPLANKEIAEFCKTAFNISFPIAGKVKVIGENAHPFFKWVADEGGIMAIPKWNFYKYLISKDGTLINWFGSDTSPVSNGFIKEIEANLPN